MPNWCETGVFFYGGAENELQRLFTDINRIREINQINNAFFKFENEYRLPFTLEPVPSEEADPLWIGGLLYHVGQEASEVNCRGFFRAFDDESEFAIQEDGGIGTCINCAWGPFVDVFQLIANAYGQEFVFCAEEPNMGVYINTDISGQHFTDRYVLEWLLEGAVGEVRFSTEAALLEQLAELKIIATSFEEAEKILNNLNEEAKKEGKEDIGSVWKFREK